MWTRRPFCNFRLGRERTGSSSGSNRLAQRSANDIEDLLDVAIRVTLFGGVADATLDVVLEDQQRDRVHRRPEGRRLLENVDAVFPAFDHPLDAADLAGDSAQPPDQDRLIARV